MTENSWTETLAEGRRLQDAIDAAGPNDAVVRLSSQFSRWASLNRGRLLTAAEEAERLRAENAQMREASKVRVRIYPKPRDYEASDARAAIRARGENDETP